MSSPLRHKAAALEAVPKSYDDAVRVLAVAHAAGPDYVEIYSQPDPTRQVVRLIEVSDTFPEGAVERSLPADGAQAVPVFALGPAADFSFRSEIIQITPAEWLQIRREELQLNRNWGDLNHAQRVSVRLLDHLIQAADIILPYP